MYRPGSYSNPGGYGDRYDEDRYGGRDDDRNGYGREREWGGNEDRYGRDSYGREGDRYGREYDERYTRDGYRDDDYSGRNRSTDEYNSGSRSSEKERDHAYDDDAQYSSRFVCLFLPMNLQVLFSTLPIRKDWINCTP